MATLVREGDRREVRAHPGIVVEIVPGRAIVTETTGAWVSGVWGPRVVGGVVRTAGNGPSTELDPRAIDGRYTYSILIAGGSISAAALLRCAELEVRAVIVGGVTSSALTVAAAGNRRSISLPEALSSLGRAQSNLPPLPALMLIDGFGSTSMPEEAWDVLARCDGREAALFAPGRPETPRIVVQLPRREAAA
ncbi:MAG: hypothetical protein WKH64_05480 [Chloroflexia bacterium]